MYHFENTIYPHVETEYRVTNENLIVDMRVDVPQKNYFVYRLYRILLLVCKNRNTCVKTNSILSKTRAVYIFGIQVSSKYRRNKSYNLL